MSGMGPIKQLALKTFLMPGFPAFLRYVQRDCATVFMLHRFQDVERGIAGCDAAHLRRVLDYLIRNNYELVSLLDLFERLEGKGPSLRGAVAFTIDDGYIEQATVAAPIFAEFDCPVTTFVTTGFIDGKVWFWWDQIDYAFDRTAHRAVQSRIGNAIFHFQWDDKNQRAQVRDEFTARCKRVSEAEKLTAIADLARALEVEIPRIPPPYCAPMSWDQARLCEEKGMTFGPHSVTHVMLSRAAPDAVGREISESWVRLRAETRRPVPVFCYPNGEWSDFGVREIAELRRLGFRGAVVSEPGYASAMTFRDGEDNRFKVRRFGFPDDMPHVVQYVSGVERFKQVLRGSAGG